MNRASFVGFVTLTILGRLACTRAWAESPPGPSGESNAPIAQKCEATNPFPSGIVMVRAIRVYTTKDGESAFETVEFHGESAAYFKPGELFTHLLLGGATKVQLVAGPPEVTLPAHASLGKEMFLTLQGSSVVTLPTGEERAVTAGTLVIFDDKGSKKGHSGRTGPCGYVAINIIPDNTVATAPPKSGGQ